MVIYMTGATDLIDRTTAEAWRSDLKRLLEDRGADYIDPFYAPKVGHSAEDVFLRNRQSFRSADGIFAEHAFHVPHYGTTVEIEEAARTRKPTVVWTGNMKPPLYLMRHKGSRFLIAHDLSEAVESLIALATQVIDLKGDRSHAVSGD